MSKLIEVYTLSKYSLLYAIYALKKDERNKKMR